MDLQQIIDEYQERLRKVRDQLTQLAQTEQQLIGAIKLAAQLIELRKREDENEDHSS